MIFECNCLEDLIISTIQIILALILGYLTGRMYEENKNLRQDSSQEAEE